MEDGIPAALARFEIIDAHTHVFPPRVFEAVWRWFDAHGWPIRYRLQAAECVRHLLERGVARVATLHYAHVPGMARGLNEFVADLARAEPRVIACATVLPGEPGARAVLDEALGPLGCRGIKIHCHVQCVAADDPRLDDVYAAAAAHGVPVVIHAGDAPASPHYQCDVQALCPPAAIARALRRHPRTTIVIPHLGAEQMEAVAALLEQHEHLWLDTTMALAGDEALAMAPTMQRPAAAWRARAERIVRTHWRRLLYGSDFPNVPYAWNRELAVLAELGLPGDGLSDEALSDEALAAVLGGNARKVFRL